MLCFSIYLFLFIHLAVPGIGRGVWDLRSSALTGDGPLHWKLRVLASEPPGKSLTVHDSKSNFVSPWERKTLALGVLCLFLPVAAVVVV